MMFRSSVLLIVIPVTTLAIGLNFDEILEGKKYIDEDKSEWVSTNILCGYECYKNPSCLSFAYNNVSQQCCLYERILTDQDNSTDSDGWRTFTLKTGGNNVALGKPTMQISNFNSSKYFSSWAVDGNLSSMSATSYHQHAWWFVDLQDKYRISWIHVILFNFELGFNVRVSSLECSPDYPFNATLCYYLEDMNGNEFVITSCNQPSSSLNDVRCVYIERYNTRSDVMLIIKEVEVYSRNLCC